MKGQAVLAALLTVATVFLIACGPAAPAATPAPTSVPVLPLGQSAQVEGLKITIGNLRRAPKPNGEEEFVVFHVTAENVGSGNKTINPNDFYLVDGKGERKTYDWSPPKEASGAPLKQSYLGPNEKAEGDVAFVVPKGDAKAVLTYQQPVTPQVMNPQLINWGVK